MSTFQLWAKAAGIRAIKTIAQTAVSMIPVAVMITEVDWILVTGTALLSGVLSVLTSVAGLPEVTEAEEIEALEDEVINKLED